MGLEGQGGQVSWTQVPVTRRRASWAGVIGFPQRAQGWLAGASRVGLRAERGVANGTQADRAGIGHREADPAGAEVVQVSLGYSLADRHPVSTLSHPFTVPPGQRDFGHHHAACRSIYGVALSLELHYIWWLTNGGRSNGPHRTGCVDLVRRWADAEEENDTGALDGLLARDFAGVGPFGFVLTRING